MSKNVLVIGTGTIGEPLIGLLAEHKESLGLDKVIFFKRTPLSEERGKVEALLRKGAEIVSTNDALSEFHQLGFNEIKDVELAYEQSDVIIDCTPSGNDNWEKIYSSLSQDKRFMAQGSEHGFGPFFAWGINNEILKDESNKFLIASCNTHNIASIVKAFALDQQRDLLEGKFVCLRRANDVSQNDSFSPSPTITKHTNQNFGTHHARDVYELFAQEGKELNLFINKDDIEENLKNSDFLIETEKMSSNKVFSFGRDHGYHGRLLSHGVVANHSLHVKENTLTGYCFTPQDGNALLSSVAATVQHYYKDTWKEKMEIFNRYIFKNI